MTTLRCIALDDEPLALELLEDNIRSVPFLQLAGSYRTAMDALPQLQGEAIDLVFSDIQMPGLSGTQLIASLPLRPMFILITAHEKFAVESFALDVVDYLLKPVPYDRFLKACNKALELHKLRHVGEAAPQQPEARDFIFVPVDYRMVKLLLSELERVEGVKDYVRFYFNNGKRPLLVRMSMKAAQDALPEGDFIRIHKSHIVGIRAITAVRRGSLFIGEEELPVGDQYKEAVQQLVEGR